MKIQELVDNLGGPSKRWPSELSVNGVIWRLVKGACYTPDGEYKDRLFFDVAVTPSPRGTYPCSLYENSDKICDACSTWDCKRPEDDVAEVIVQLLCDLDNVMEENIRAVRRRCTGLSTLMAPSKKDLA